MEIDKMPGNAADSLEGNVLTDREAEDMAKRSLDAVSYDDLAEIRNPRLKTKTWEAQVGQVRGPMTLPRPTNAEFVRLIKEDAMRKVAGIQLEEVTPGAFLPLRPLYHVIVLHPRPVIRVEDLRKLFGRTLDVAAGRLFRLSDFINHIARKMKSLAAPTPR